jgi:hypothetical protein
MIGSMTYKLEFPQHLCVHLISHVSYLNKVIGENISVHNTFPELDEEGKILSRT